MTAGPRRTGVVAAVLGLALGATACTHRRDRSVVVLEDGALAPPDVATLAGGAGADAVGAPTRWRRERARGPGPARAPRSPAPSADPGAPAGPPGTSAADGASAARRGPPAAGGAAGAASVPPRADAEPAVAGPPVKTSAAPPAHQAVADAVSLEQRQRETFLASVTTVEADKITLFVPPRYAAEATRPGDGELRLRRLTLRGRVVRLVPRTDGRDDVSISARGRVSFHADLPASVIAETGLRSLLVRNDGWTPLR